MSDTKTPLCDALRKNPFDSTDVRAWEMLATQLEIRCAELERTVKEAKHDVDCPVGKWADYVEWCKRYNHVPGPGSIKPSDCNCFKSRAKRAGGG